MDLGEVRTRFGEENTDGICKNVDESQMKKPTCRGESETEVSIIDYGLEADEDLDWEVNPEAVRKLSEKYKGEEFPLFMGEDVLDPNNPHIQALQALIYDGETPESLAEQFRVVGNEYFQDGKSRYKDAVIAYTKGIEQKSSNKEVNSLLYSNRAHIHLLMRRYVECVDDCRASLKENPSNVKAAYRGCKASIKMQLYKQAINFAVHGLRYDNENAELLRLKSTLEERLSEIEKRKEQRIQEEERKRRMERNGVKSVVNVINDRGYFLTNPIYDVIHTYNNEIKCVNCSDDGGSELLIYPILVLLDEPMLCEFICEGMEDSQIKDHLKVMFPKDRHLPWDTLEKYNWDNLMVYYEPGPPHESRVWEVSPEKTIKQVIDIVKYIPKIPTFHVIAKDSICLEEFTSITYTVVRDPLLL
ncbi:protein with 2 TPR domains [Cryptosporidium ryanae]|uniref:protein with 2 TPR domains n=1 Tax=Cryptosporidium ryanae TaxID=515981 RepID=UPI00351A4B91|nr:protein with 2 TPR domains [Cryptosporidium ryanae]